ncbi:MAG: anhydro-N-acetylmuramic acid kinase [Thermomicrobiales bacterium]|jgi:anhydro-N-acetylmuramic acid kinase|nr:anhydro-N-acetylmuramic acid kinase [Thermomicrobiales bacterium]
MEISHEMDRAPKDKKERFIRLLQSQHRKVIGLATGTSADGIDAILLDIEDSDTRPRFKVLATGYTPYPPDVRAAIFEQFQPATSRVDDICNLNFVIGEIAARAVRQIVEEAGLQAEDIDLIGAFGQTTYFETSPRQTGDISTGSMLSLMEPVVIAERTGITTVSNLLQRDIAAGGQGAPMTGFSDFTIYHDPERNRALQNIGGIANVGIVPADGDLNRVMGFDTGPGNMIIDAVATHITQGQQTYDHDGLLAAKGTVSRALLDRLLDDDYIRQPPPKCTGRERYGVQFTKQIVEEARALGLSDEDLIATVTAFTAESIIYNYQKFVLPHTPIDEVIVGGGGANNPYLMDLLRKGLDPIRVVTDTEYGMLPDFREAILVALLANETISFRASNVPSVTGARNWVALGSITPA